MSCLEVISKTFGGDLKPSEIASIGEEVRQIYLRASSLKAAGKIKNEGDFVKEALQALNISREIAVKQKEVTLRNAKVRADVMTRVMEDWSKAKPSERLDVVESLIFHDAKFDRPNIESTRDLFKSKYQAFDHYLESKTIDGQNVRDVFMTGDVDKEVIMDSYAFASTGKHISKSPIIQEITKSLKKLNNVILSDKQSQGFDIKARADYIVPMTWNPLRVSSINFGEFVADIEKSIDMDKFLEKFGWTKDTVDQKKYAQVMEDIFTNLKSKHDIVVEDTIGDLVINAHSEKKGHKFTKSRTFDYKDGESFHYIYNKYSNNNLYEGVHSYINSTSRSMAMSKILGPSPKSNLAVVLNKMKDIAIKEGDTKTADALGNDQRRDALLRIATGMMRPTDDIWTSGARAITRSMNLIRMGSAFITASATDPVFGALARTSLMGKANVYSSFLKVIDTQIKVLSPSDRKQVALMFKAVTDDYTMNMVADRYDIDSTPMEAGWTQRVYDGIMKTYLNKQQILVARTGAALDIGMTLHSELAHNSSSGFIKRLSKYGMDDTAVNVLKMANAEYKGAKLLSPAAIDNLTPQQIIDIIGNKEITMNKINADGSVTSTKVNVSEANAIKYRDNLSNNLASYVNDLTKVYSPTPNAYTKYMSGAELTSPPAKAFANIMLQYKNFGFAVLRSWRFANANLPNSAKVTKFAAMAGTVSLLTAMKYGATSVSQMLQGELPDDITSPEVLRNSIINSGGGGIVADLILTDWDKRKKSFSSYAMGPFMGQVIDDVRPLISKGFSGDLEGKDVVKSMLRYTPNPWYLRAILQGGIVDNIRSDIEPAYNRNKQEKKDEASGLLWRKDSLLPN